MIAKLLNADVAVLSTVLASTGKREGIPNVLKEAMACGLPVVGSRISGIPELVDHEHTGLLVPPGDARALGVRQKLVELLADDNVDVRVRAAQSLLVLSKLGSR